MMSGQLRGAYYGETCHDTVSYEGGLIRVRHVTILSAMRGAY